MTNNLKILTLTILSIFVFILTGYFYFSSPSVKNQIIANNSNSNEEEEKDNKDPNINNRDSDEKKEEKKEPLSILNVALYLIIFIIIIGIIIFIFVNFVNKEEEVSKFEFNAKSKGDFKKENFCPTFFVIDLKKLNKNKFDNVKENADSFFEILAGLILPKNEIASNKIRKVKILLFDTSNVNEDGAYCLNFIDILNKIFNFANLSTYFNDDEIDNLKKYKIKMQKIQEKYGEKFRSYLYSYLLYHLSEIIGNNGIKVEIKQSNCENIDKENISKMRLQGEYNINDDIIDEILKKLLNDNRLQNVTYRTILKNQKK